MKLPRFIPTKLLRKKTSAPRRLEATARRVSRNAAEEMDEPNVRLSSAFIVVLVLHVVAVGGIYAFNSIKARRSPVVESSYKPVPAKPAARTAAAEELATPTPLAAANTAAAAPKTETRTKPAEKASEKVAEKKPAVPEKSGMVRNSGETYVVEKGDNPVAIARRLGVSYEELLKLNKISDPRKLQIGTKLRVPAKKTAAR